MQQPIFILGMHRSGTSCLAAVLQAAGAQVPGEAVRNWDNPLGHHEAVALVRLNEDVLAHSGGHWLAPPPAVRWTAAQAAERDRLLALETPGPALWKDPRTLLVLPFWQAATLPMRWVGVVRHPLAVAHSLLAWRGMPVDEGLQLWRAHNERLAACGAPVLDFDTPRASFVAAVARLMGVPVTADLARAYVADLVHHGAGPSPGTVDAALLAACEALHGQLTSSSSARSDADFPAIAFPWVAVMACIEALRVGALDQATTAAHSALAGRGDPAAVLAPIAAACLKHHQPTLLLALLEGAPLAAGLAGLLRGKALLALGHPAEAAAALEAACGVPAPLYETRHLLPVALWASGAASAADGALEALLPSALYPFRLLARRAEWAWAQGQTATALDHMASALAAAPTWRHGRLLHRRATWRAALGDAAGAAADRALAAQRDPSFRRRGA